MKEYKISDRLTELRSAKGFTQKELATRLGVSDKTVSKWENGISEPDLTMLIKLAELYNISTDSLLGVSQSDPSEVQDTLNSIFKSLDRGESAIKAFDLVRSIIPATMNKFATKGTGERTDAFPQDFSPYSRFKIANRDFFEFVSSSKDVNVAVMLLRNPSDSEWMKDPSKQQKTVRLFKFLSDESALSVLYFIHSSACSESFTAEYISVNTGVELKRVTAILDEFCFVGECRLVIAHLAEGEAKIYECFGDGIILSLITLAYEHMCGRKAYSYDLSNGCKMIGGKI